MLSMIHMLLMLPPCLLPLCTTMRCNMRWHTQDASVSPPAACYALLHTSSLISIQDLPRMMSYTPRRVNVPAQMFQCLP